MNRKTLFVALTSTLALVAIGCATTPAQPTAEPTPPAAEEKQQVEAPAAPVEEPEERGPLKANADLAPVPPRPFQQTGPMQLVLQPEENNPLVSFRLVFRSGSADDPKGKEGLTALTASVMTEGGTKELTSAQLLEALFPMAAELSVRTDKELTTFAGRVHQDNLDRFFEIFSDVLLEPRFDAKEFERLRANALNAVQNQLRSEDDEELGKAALDSILYANHPYGHSTGGTVQGLKAITLDDLRAHAKKVFTQDRLILGLAGAVDEALATKVKERFAALPAKSEPLAALPPVTQEPGTVLIVKKPTLSTAVSMGFVYPLRREDPDFYPLMVALSHLGEHRQFNGVLFNELREKRGMNYGNYTYAQHFIQEPGTTYAAMNIPRQQQDFTIWIRPVEPKNGVFATRGAVYFLDQLVTEGIPQDRFELTRGFLRGYSRLWQQTSQRRLGQAIDDLLYGTPDFLGKLHAALDTMTREQVNAAVKKHLDPENLSFAFVAADADGLAEQLRSGAPSPIVYPSPKAPAVLEVDEEIEAQSLPIDPAKVRIVEVKAFMEK